MYSMSDNSPAEKIAVNAAIEYLNSLSETQQIISVENDPEYQKIDVDLIWKTSDNTQSFIEVKGDTYITGNFAFEITSNQSLNTPGCFLYTQANYIFYYFIKWKRLYILPMPETRNWFTPLLDEYREIYPQTVNEGTRDYSHTTVCKLVPIQDVKAAIPKMLEIQL